MPSWHYGGHIIPALIHRFSAHLRLPHPYSRPQATPSLRSVFVHCRIDRQSAGVELHHIYHWHSIQGTGGGGIISLTEILITDLVPIREHCKWFGFQSLTWAIGSVAGPLIGGTFAQEASWRWISWINLPFCAPGFLTLPFCL